MATIKIVGQTSVKSVKNKFKEEVGVDLRIYNQELSLASDNDKISQIRSKQSDKSEIEIHGRTKIRNVESFFQENYGITIDFLDGNGNPAGLDASLAEVKRTYPQ